MEIGFVFKIAAVGIIVAVVNSVLQKASKEEYTVLTTIAGIIIVVLMLLPKLTELGEAITSFFEF